MQAISAKMFLCRVFQNRDPFHLHIRKTKLSLAGPRHTPSTRATQREYCFSAAFENCLGYVERPFLHGELMVFHFRMGIFISRATNAVGCYRTIRLFFQIIENSLDRNARYYEELLMLRRWLKGSVNHRL
jgi:hypothetical protein